jgi:hypothetical protein
MMMWDDDLDSDNVTTRTRLPRTSLPCPASDAGHKRLACPDRHGPLVTTDWVCVETGVGWLPGWG